MRMPVRAAAPAWRVALAGLVVAAAGAGVVGDPGLPLPLVLSSVLVVALAFAVAALAQHMPAIASGGPAPQRPAEARRSIRQCDPKAAGHTRPRAPSRILSVCR